jgi:hypothetical protein
MTNRKQKVTEDTLVYINDLKGTIDFLKEDLAEIEDILGLNELAPSHNGGGYRKVDDPDKFEETLNDAINLIFTGHLNLREKVIPMLKSKRETAAEQLAIKRAVEAHTGTK